MSGIYIHIPFCKRRCRYCDFYSTTLTERAEAYIDAACQELISRKDYLKGDPVRTLYIGGGTPSQLSPTLLGRLIQTAAETYAFDRLLELTVEANPDDITPSWIDGISQAISPFCAPRISMGIQTFHDDTLRLIGRRHDASQAVQTVEMLQDKGISHISIDLMYGLPDETPERWQQDLDKALSLHVPHISAYHLSYEEGTPLWQMRQRGEVREADENDSVAYFRMLRRALLDAGYIHYEISNFALPGHQAIHNSSYWSGEPYLGIGPGAHSYDGTNRCWNKPDLLGYLKGDSIIEEETLTDDERYDEYIMTRLRTAKGIDFDEIARLFGEEKKRYCSRRAQPHIKSHRLHVTPDGRLALTEEGIFVSDGIIADLFSE